MYEFRRNVREKPVGGLKIKAKSAELKMGEYELSFALHNYQYRRK